MSKSAIILILCVLFWLLPFWCMIWFGTIKFLFLLIFSLAFTVFASFKILQFEKEEKQNNYKPKI